MFPISPGVSKTAEYKDAVYRGKDYAGALGYSLSEKDRFICVDTPVGQAEVLLLHNREDFEKCACALGNRCEPRELPKSVGAFMIGGLINWEKVRSHLEKHKECEMFGWIDWERMRSTGCDYKDKIILLSSGYYSGISPETMGLSEDAWTEKSITIRMYHEIAHFVCRTLHPKEIDAIRDEIFADMIGLVAAFGHYDVEMAKTFLGIHDTTVSENARLRYYLKDQDLHTVIRTARFWTSWLASRTETEEESINDYIINIFQEMLSIPHP